MHLKDKTRKLKINVKVLVIKRIANAHTMSACLRDIEVLNIIPGFYSGKL
jgi:hypothetical protein